MGDKFRVMVRFDPAAGGYLAEAPELRRCLARGSTRGAAVGELERLIEDQLATMKEQGIDAPVPVDEIRGDSSPGAVESAASGEVKAQVSRSLHRELLFLARAENVPLDHLLAELIAEGLALRAGRELAPRGRRREGRERGEPGADRPRGGRHSYTEIMENKASFLEYVRGLDAGGGELARRGARRGRHRRRGGGGQVPPGGSSD